MNVEDNNVFTELNQNDIDELAKKEFLQKHNRLLTIDEIDDIIENVRKAIKKMILYKSICC